VLKGLCTEKGGFAVKLPFEQWLDSNSFREEVRALFHESVLAYKADCNRASLIMAYLGLLAEVRSRILKASSPGSFEPAEWNRIQEAVRDEEHWDTVVAELLLRDTVKDGKTVPVPFTISNDEKQGVRYFRMLRNKCAHGKNEEIGPSHVEALWAFVRSNLPKFVINGSLRGSIKATLEHFDSDLTPPGRSFDALAASLNAALRPNEVPNYLDALLQEQPSMSLLETIDWDQSWFCEVLVALSCQLDSSHEPAFKEWLEQEEHFDALRETMLRFPECDIMARLDDMIVRKLWHRGETLRTREVRLYINLRRKQLIPADEEDESMRYVVTHMGYHKVLSDDEVSDLETWGLWTYVKAYLLDSIIGENMDFKTANSRTWLVERYLERCGVDVDVAGAILRMETSNQPFDVERVIVQYLHGHSDQWQIVKDLGDVPSTFMDKVEKGS
jgi:hypothetical protein